MRRTTGNSRISRKDSGSSIAEFGPAMFILLAIVVPFLIAMLSLFDGAATLYFATANAARAAGPSNSFSAAKTNMTNAAQQVIGGPLGSFARITPNNSTGMQIQIVQVSISGQNTVPFNPPVDPNNYFYQYQVTAQRYAIAPLFWIGQPFPITFTSSCNVEHPDGLTQ